MVDLAARRARLDEYLDGTRYDAVWFARPAAFAWLTGGRNVLDGSEPVGVAAAGYVADDAATGNNDAPTENDDGGEFRAVAVEDADRLAAEELPDEFALTEASWYESNLPEAVAAVTPEPAAADVDVPGLDRVDPGPLRHPLVGDDVERYRGLCEETAAAVERVCRELGPDDTEHEVASALRITLSSGAMEAPTVLVAGGDRAERFGAAPPSGSRLGDYAVVSVTTRRAGLHASLTRTVAFDPPDWLFERHRAAARVEASALAATRAVASERGIAADVFEELQGAYEAVGHPDAWREAPQGGAAGFARREWVATPDETEPVTAPMGYAWSPTVEGARSEDTYLVTTDAETEDHASRVAGFECLTATPNWPTIEVAATDRDVRLERHAILEP